MSLYLKQIEQLIVLQKVDDEMIQLEKTLQEAPEKVNSIQEKLDQQKKQQAELNEKIALLQEQDHKLHREIEDDNDKIKKSKNKLMMVENSREYHAIMREMDNLEKTNRMREEEKIALGEDLATQNSLLETINNEISKLEKELETTKQNLEEQLNIANNRLEELKAERKKAKQDIPKPILSRYEFIRSRLNNPVIVPVEN
ncbi:MAG TPA: hypothetical protein VKN82_03565, partial [Desulfohalobiaceae bacterium]|nr:hypothetical protein [Desulfohalobiaceae bacterium]